MNKTNNINNTKPISCKRHVILTAACTLMYIQGNYVHTKVNGAFKREYINALKKDITKKAQILSQGINEIRSTNNKYDLQDGNNYAQTIKKNIETLTSIRNILEESINNLKSNSKKPNSDGLQMTKGTDYCLGVLNKIIENVDINKSILNEIMIDTKMEEPEYSRKKEELLDVIKKIRDDKNLVGDTNLTIEGESLLVYSSLRDKVHEFCLSSDEKGYNNFYKICKSSIGAENIKIVIDILRRFYSDTLQKILTQTIINFNGVHQSWFYSLMDTIDPINPEYVQNNIPNEVKTHLIDVLGDYSGGKFLKQIIMEKDKNGHDHLYHLASDETVPIQIKKKLISKCNEIKYGDVSFLYSVLNDVSKNGNKLLLNFFTMENELEVIKYLIDNILEFSNNQIYSLLTYYDGIETVLHFILRLATTSTNYHKDEHEKESLTRANIRNYAGQYLDYLLTKLKSKSNKLTEYLLRLLSFEIFRNSTLKEHNPNLNVHHNCHVALRHICEEDSLPLQTKKMIFESMSSIPILNYESTFNYLVLSDLAKTPENNDLVKCFNKFNTLLVAKQLPFNSNILLSLLTRQSVLLREKKQNDDSGDKYNDEVDSYNVFCDILSGRANCSEDGISALLALIDVVTNIKLSHTDLSYTDYIGTVLTGFEWKTPNSAFCGDEHCTGPNCASCKDKQQVHTWKTELIGILQTQGRLNDGFERIETYIEPIIQPLTERGIISAKQLDHIFRNFATSLLDGKRIECAEQVRKRIAQILDLLEIDDDSKFLDHLYKKMSKCDASNVKGCIKQYIGA